MSNHNVFSSYLASCCLLWSLHGAVTMTAATIHINGVNELELVFVKWSAKTEIIAIKRKDLVQHFLQLTLQIFQFPSPSFYSPSLSMSLQGFLCIAAFPVCSSTALHPSIPPLSHSKPILPASHLSPTLACSDSCLCEPCSCSCLGLLCENGVIVAVLQHVWTCGMVRVWHLCPRSSMSICTTSTRTGLHTQIKAMSFELHYPETPKLTPHHSTKVNLGGKCGSSMMFINFDSVRLD